MIGQVTPSDLCVFQFKLVEVEEVVLLTKKGYLTIALSHSRDGRVLLRRHEGIRDWFNVIKVNMMMIKITVVMLLLFQSKVLECKARQVQHDIASNNLNVEAWLLARKSLAGSNCVHKLNHLLNNSNVPATGTPRATPYMAHNKRLNMDEADNAVEEEEVPGDKKQMMGNQAPRGINRLSSIIKCLINCTPEATGTPHFLAF